jgi:hypothetical protein
MVHKLSHVLITHSVSFFNGKSKTKFCSFLVQFLTKFNQILISSSLADGKCIQKISYEYVWYFLSYRAHRQTHIHTYTTLQHITLCSSVGCTDKPPRGQTNRRFGLTSLLFLVLDTHILVHNIDQWPNDNYVKQLRAFARQNSFKVGFFIAHERHWLISSITSVLLYWYRHIPTYFNAHANIITQRKR